MELKQQASSLWYTIGIAPWNVLAMAYLAYCAEPGLVPIHVLFFMDMNRNHLSLGLFRSTNESQSIAANAVSLTIERQCPGKGAFSSDIVLSGHHIKMLPILSDIQNTKPYTYHLYSEVEFARIVVRSQPDVLVTYSMGEEFYKFYPPILILPA